MLVALSSRRLGTGLVDDHLTAFQLRAIEGVDGSLASGVIFHFDKTETSRAAGLTVGDQADRLDGSILLEGLDQLVLV